MGVSSRPGAWEVGLQAVSRAKAGHPYTVCDLTMLLGRKMEALRPKDLKRWAFALRPGLADKAEVECPSKKSNSPNLAYPEQLAAMLLSTIKQRAETFTGKRVNGAVVSVPAASNRTQRQGLRDACSIAGIHVERLVISSTASAVAHADSLIAADDGEAPNTIKLVLVVDCGGGSLNVTLARVRPESEAEDLSGGIEVQVEATVGDLETGGEALTDQLFDYFYLEAKASDTSSKTSSPAFSRRLRRACVLAQRILSTSQQAAIDLPPWQLRRGSPSGGVAGFYSSISRAHFENLCETEWSRLPDAVEQVLARAKVKKEDVDVILVTGGAMQVPKFRECLGDCFTGYWDRIMDLPKHTVAVGTALVAAQNGRHSLLYAPTPLTLGIRSASGDTLVVVPPSTPLPTRQSRIYYASCQSEIKFDILEGLLDPEQQANHTSYLEHCMGHVPIDGSRASAPLVLKLEIVFEVDATDLLTIVVSDNSNNRTTRLIIAGDETCLSTEAIALAKAHLSEVLNDAVDTQESKVASPSLAMIISPQTPQILAPVETCPVDTLRSYVAALTPMVQTNSLSVCIPPGDLFVLRSKVEHANSWLAQIDPNQQNSLNTDQQTITAREHLRQIRTLHLSSTASSAFSQLRQELGLLN
ncbi:hsp70-like protein [Phytophthora cinnamomi]|uniref:hsp70-like protein n=1 Tax=Phytophthora cinnamomi TaxID=4785 RepID=UPI00355AABCC|nr:hsp70-like protein [Phytophthora cinnamomi]